MRFLILVKHAMREIEPVVPADRWRLGAAGRRQCTALAQELERYLPATVAASREPKATETAERIAGELAVPWRTVQGLHELRRRSVGWLDDGRFEAAMRGFFERPGKLVFGEETADEARRRFGEVVDRLVDEQPATNLIVVAHGTVNSLYATNGRADQAFELWRRLSCPSLIALSLPERRVLTVVERMADRRGADECGG
jgi:2,3-bisphosphoglycerate-dependent phosphoglycerate mutase